MPKIPEDFDLTPYLVGKQLTQIQLNPYNFSLVFEEYSIFCAGRMDAKQSNEWEQWYDSTKGWLDTSHLSKLVDKQVKLTDWRVESENTFSVDLDNGISLRFVGDFEGYENFYFNGIGWVI